MISKRAARIAPSPTLAITAKAKELKESGVDVISFGAGEPDFDTPDYIKEAAISAIREGFTKYTPTSGIADLKKAVCKKFKEDNGLDYAPANILVSVGAKQCLFNLIQTLIDPGDEVLIPLPYWVSYEEMVKFADGVCVFVKSDTFALDPARLEKAVTPRTKLLILNSPSNPSGAVCSKHDLEKIADICVNHNISVISDEIYEKLTYGKPHVSIASLNERIKKLAFVVNGVSKSYAMTGWRIGYCAGDEAMIKAASALQDHSTSNPTSIAQKAALAALINKEESDRSIALMRAEYQKRRDYMVARLKKIPHVRAELPDGAFYVFADVSELYHPGMEGSVPLCKELLEKAHIALIPGAAFGDDRFVRLSYATSYENIKKGMDRLEQWVNSAEKQKNS